MSCLTESTPGGDFRPVPLADRREAQVGDESGLDWRRVLTGRGLAKCAIAVVSLQYLLFRAYFTTAVAPYYPRNHDQLATYDAIYQAYFFLLDHGVLATARASLAMPTLAFKSWIVPAFCLVATCLFGAQRLAIASVNFLFFVAGQIIVWRFLGGRHGVAAALLGWGLFLLSGTHYLDAGGLDDLRFDYAGMMAFGLAFLSMVSLVEHPGRKRLATALLTVGFSLSTRSITISYILGTEVLLLGVFAARRVARGVDPARRVTFLAWLLVATLAGSGVFLAILGRDVYGYYGQLVFGQEILIRRAQFGVATLGHQLLYYPRSAVHHFWNYLIVGVAAAGYAVLFWLRASLARPPVRLPGAPPARARAGGSSHSLMLVFGATLVSIYTALTLSSQSPVVIGVLTVPITVALATLVLQATSGGGRLVPMGVACVVAGWGLAHYTHAMVTASPSPPWFRDEGMVVNRFFRDLDRCLESHDSAGRNPQRPLVIYWMLVHPGYNPGAFDVYLYEHRLAALPGTWRDVSHGIFPISEREVSANLQAADLVVAPSRLPSASFEYPSTTSLRNLESLWKPRLQRQFTHMGAYQPAATAWAVSLYARPGVCSPS